MGGRRDWRKEGRKGKERGREGEGGTCSKVLGGIDAPAIDSYNEIPIMYFSFMLCFTSTLSLIHI